MIKKYHFQILIVILTLFFGLTKSVYAQQSVSFNSPVNTRTKPIELQLKKTYELEKAGVFASNEFDGARLSDFILENDSTASVIIKPENSPINNSGYYAFKTWSSSPKPFYFTFHYPKGYKHRYIPKLKINNNWTTIDPTFVYKNDSIVTIKLNLSKEPILVAAQEIQSSTEVKNWYTSVVSGKEYVTVKSAGNSVLGKYIPVLDIYKGDKKNKKIIVLLTRQHPPETTGYYAFQSFLETILDDSELSDVFLKTYRIIAFPIANPDGVDLGHWRHNYGGIDLNRDWSVYNQPEIKQIVKFINSASEDDEGDIILGLDFHSTTKDVFYTNKKRDNTSMPNFIDYWFAGLERNIPGYKVNESSGNSQEPVSKGWFLYGHNAVGITYEIGDATPKEDIVIRGQVSAKEMMKILVYIIKP